MPNWCSNLLTVLGPEDELEAFRIKAIGHSPWQKPKPNEEPNPLNFHGLVPIPKEVLGKEYAKAGSEWEAKNWGARWGACGTTVVEEGGDRLKYDFETAWEPPIAFLGAVARKWPGLTFLLEYEEEGNGFKGLAKAHAAKLEDHRVHY